MLRHSVLRLSFLCLSFSAVLSCLVAEDATATRRRLLNAFESGSYSRAGSWKMQKVKFLPTDSKDEAKIGSKLFRFSGVAEIKGAKGDCSIYGGKLSSITKLSMWVKLDVDSNVAKVGFQTRDKDGEGLFVLFDADWTGWRKLETDFVSGLEQAWKQADKNGAVDYPVNGVNLVWFTKEPGDTHLDVDALELVENAPADSGRLDGEIIFPAWSHEDSGGLAVAILNNSRRSKEDVEIELVVQEDPALFNKTPPDPVLGSDHAIGCKGWVIFDDKRKEDMSLTDGDENSSSSTEWTNDHYTEASQVIALGREINVKEIKFKSGDANWLWRMDVLASGDGENFSPVPELQDVNMHKRWGEFALGIKTPFKAKFIKLHYKTESGDKKPIIRMPAAMMIYDGIEDEKFDLPETGRRILAEKKSISVPPCDYVVEKIAIPALPRGAYLLSAVIKSGGKTEISNSSYFSFKDAEKSLGEKSRFGINGSDIGAVPFHRQLGLGWVRFENMKWAFISPEKGKFAFDGSVAPWHVREDEIIKAYTETGLSYLPYVFQTPRWASSAPEGHKNFRGFPPKDFNDYGDCIFQIVARYGSAKHPEGALQTNDKASGMGILKVIELWNEPNLNAESWGPWVDSIEPKKSSWNLC